MFETGTVKLICDIAIFVFGTGSIYLLSLNNKYSGYGMVMGLIVQPFWFIHAYTTNSWGIFLVSVIYAVSYINGVHNFFFRKTKGKKRFGINEICVATNAPGVSPWDYLLSVTLRARKLLIINHN